MSFISFDFILGFSCKSRKWWSNNVPFRCFLAMQFRSTNMRRCLLSLAFLLKLVRYLIKFLRNTCNFDFFCNNKVFFCCCLHTVFSQTIEWFFGFFSPNIHYLSIYDNYTYLNIFKQYQMKRYNIKSKWPWPNVIMNLSITT